MSGTVHDPAGRLPLFNVIVYAPTAPLGPLPTGMSCDRCGAVPSGAPAATTLSGVRGQFRLDGIPPGTNVPLVFQIGKWRRQVLVPTVTACADTALTDVNLTRLPRTQAEGEMPRIAVTTGGADALECLIRRLGVDDSEFSTDGGAGRVHLYAGGDGTAGFSSGAAFAPASSLWASPAKLASYDLILMSCEGSVTKFSAQKPMTSIDNVASYANAGGRLLLTHLHTTWLTQRTADFSGTAAYAGVLPAPPDGSLVTIAEGFPKGAALAEWLGSPLVNASIVPGQIIASGADHSVTAVNPPTTEWMYIASNPADTLRRRSVQYLSFDTPVGSPPAMQCGRVALADTHVKASAGAAGGDDSAPVEPFPTGCKSNDMSPQQKAVEYLFFDLASCLLPDTTQPGPPPTN